jgi:predicted acyltransferase
MTLVPVPGYGAGDLSYPDHNLAAHLDRLLLRGHLGGRTWDGLGLLSTLPAVASTLLGVLAAGLLRSGREPREIAGWIFVAGWAGILGGLAWDLVFPINKLLWTSSYVLFTTGAALELLGVCYWLVDIHGFRRTALPAVVLGSNALTAFVLSTLVYLAICPRPFNSPGFSVRRWLFEHLFLPWASPAGASLAFAITYVLLWLGVAALLYRRRIFIKV